LGSGIKEAGEEVGDSKKGEGAWKSRVTKVGEVAGDEEDAVRKRTRRSTKERRRQTWKRDRRRGDTIRMADLRRGLVGP
jgi:hypothetical protein